MAEPSGPSPEVRAKLMQLREEFAKRGEAYRRREIGSKRMEEEAKKIQPLRPLSAADTDLEYLSAAKGGIISQLRRNGKGVSSELEAMRRMSQGHRVFVTHEQDERPREIKSVLDLHAYTPDQMYTLAPEAKDKGGKIEVRPTVFDDKASRRNPEIEEAARALLEGKIKQKAYEKTVKKHKPVKPYDFIPAPATDEQAMDVLLDRQKQNWRSHENWPASHRVGLRLDIPAYERHGVWVNSIHDESGGEDKFPSSYGPVSSVRNAEFHGSPQKAVRVATGEQNKTPFARIKGELEHINEKQAIAHMKKYLNHPDYRQIGYDPRRHGDFYDRETMEPVTHSEHVVQIGPLVLAKKPKYGKRELYAKGGVTHAHHLDIEERPL